MSTPFQKRSMPIPEILGHEKIDLTRLRKQAQLSQTEIPRIPRITRTFATLDNLLKVLDEHVRTSKNEIDRLIRSVECENLQNARQLHESQVAYLKLQAHTASIQSLKECYSRYAQMYDGARTMFQAYQQQSATRRDSIDRVKLGLKECRKTLCAIEAQCESMLGTFVLNLEEINGFSRICPGDEYEVTIRYGQQKMKTRGRILKHDKNQQNWTRQIFHLKAKLADVLLIKISEVKLLGVSLKTLGTKCFEVNNFYSIEPQRMIVNANQSGTIKLSFLVHWDLYDQVDTKFSFYNPNRTYSDVTKTWSMFVGNTTLLRTVNDTLQSTTNGNSLPSKRLSTILTTNADENVHYDEILPVESDEISLTTSICQFDLLVEQIRTIFDDLKIMERSPSKIFEEFERIFDEFERQTTKTFEIENFLQHFQFLETIDDEQTIDSGFECEQNSSDDEQQRKTAEQTFYLIFVDVLQRILVLLQHLENRSEFDDEFLLDQLKNQFEQLKIATEWKRKEFFHVDQIFAESNRSIIEFWTSNRTFFMSFDVCRNKLTKLFDVSSNVAETLLNFLCCLSFRRKLSRVKAICFVQIYFLLMKNPDETKKIVDFIREQLDSFSQLSFLISTKNVCQLASLINRPTLNNEEIFGRILNEFQWKIPDELIGLLKTSIRKDFIVYLRQCLDSFRENPAKRLEIHKMIFNIQMGKQVRSNAQKSKVKQPKQQKKAKAVKTNLKRLNERVRDKVEKLDQIYDQKEEKPIEKK